MPTANEQTRVCECGHGEYIHNFGAECLAARAVVGPGRGTGQCLCKAFRPKPIDLREGEQMRHVTED